MKPLLVLGLLVAGCTKPNPALCCVDAEDCRAAGIAGDGRACPDGLRCVNQQCLMPSCATEGCSATAPVCDNATDVCEGCTESTQCEGYAATSVCEPTTGGCVECVQHTDCPATSPVCETNACRACKLDSECASAACGDDGACVAEADIIYLDAAGTDTGACSRGAPCRSLQFAVGVASTQRFHIVMAPGLYVGVTNVDSTTTSATQLYVHGHGADVEGPTDGDAAVLYLGIATTVRDLYVSSHTGGVPIDIAEQSSVLENITIRKGVTGLSLSSGANVTGFTYVGTGGTAIELSTGAHLTMDGAVIKGGYRGIRATTAVSVSVSNLLIYGTSGLALDLPYASGTIASSTIADCGTNVATGPRAVSCFSALTIRSSIIWTPGTSTQVPVSGCNLSSTIAGPVATPGASNADPKFVDPAMGDYHLASDSPARDMVDTGPPTDFEGEARPQGARFDIGADEASP